MRKRNYLITLLLSAMLVLGMSTMSWAESRSFTGDVTYTGGNSMTSNFDGSDIAAVADELEPGDDVTITIKYTNRSSDTTDWYLRNSVLTTLEEAGAAAENGGYTYILTDSGVGEIYSNDIVGGDNDLSGAPEGLHEATDGSDGEYFAINTLEPGASGTTTLYIQFEGETEVNDYQTTSASLDLQYAVEEHGVDVTKKIIDRTVKTGDTTEILKYVLIFGAAVLMLVLALLSWKRDRRDAKAEGGEDA